MSQPRDVIAAAANLLQRPGAFVQGCLATSKKGKVCDPSRGSRWDAIGATYYVCGVSLKDDELGHHTQVHAAALAGMQAAALTLHRMSLERVNDELGLEAVLAVMRLAWKRAGIVEERKRAA